MGYLRVLVIMHADMSIKVCHVTSVHPYSDGRIFQKECKSLSKKYEVTLIAPNVENHYENGVHIIGVPLPTSRIKRILSLHRVYNVMEQVDADIYHFHDPELITIALKIKKKGKKIIFDSHEDTPMQILSKDWIPWLVKKPVSWGYSIWEADRLKKFDALVSVTPTIVERLKRINTNTWQVTNYPIIMDFVEGRKWEKSVSFAGGISEQWMHTKILEAIVMTKAKYLLAGKVESSEYLNTLRNKEGWNQVEYKGILKFGDVNTMLQQSSAGLALNDYVANVGFKKGSLGNTKLFEYMAAGIPVIATDFELWKEIIETSDCGVCVDPHDTNAIADAITFFISNPKEAKQKGDNGRIAVQEEYNWASQEKILYNLYDSVISM